MPIPQQKQLLRKQQRQLRRSLLPSFRAQAARAVVRQFFRWRVLCRARHVGLYLAAGSELATAPLIAALHKRGVRVYAPRVARAHALRFVRLQAHSRCPRHALGMRQPAPARSLRLNQLDVLLIPLLGFNASGQRLGQGGGYYDRALARSSPWRPLRLGLAFAAQQLAAVPVELWDATLHGVLTERGLRRARRSL